MVLVQDRVQWQVILLAVFEISGSVHFNFSVNNNYRHESISASLTELCTGRSAQSQSDTDTGMHLRSTGIFIPSL
jgi:hypothetical protein